MRLSISVRTDLALRALRLLADEPRVWTATALAQSVGTAPDEIRRAMGAFVRAGWVVSSSGPSGGYLYTRPATQPSLLGVIEAIEGPTVPDACVLHDGKRCGLISGEPLCELHEGWLRARTVLVDVLEATPALPAMPGWPAPERAVTAPW
jgi:DNA-binding IscR family transcriptional regulator